MEKADIQMDPQVIKEPTNKESRKQKKLRRIEEKERKLREKLILV